jgi:hypothetical protein
MRAHESNPPRARHSRSPTADLFRALEAVRDAVATQGVENVSEALVHALDECGVHGLGLVEARVAIPLDEAVVRRIRNVHGIVRKIEEERPAVGDGLVHALDCLAGEGLGQKDVLAVIGFRPRDIPDVTPGRRLPSPDAVARLQQRVLRVL